jgi:hypothetical protein
LQEQFQLRPIQSLTARTKHPPHQQIYFLPQQFILPTTLRQCLQAFFQLAGEFFFAQRHRLHSLTRLPAKKVQTFETFFQASRSYHGRNFAPRKSTPSVSIASACGVNFNLVVPGSTFLGHENVPLQPLGQNPQSRAVPAQNLDPRMPPVAEHKQRALSRLLTQPFGHHGVQPVEPFAHIARFHRHEHFQAARKT